MIEVKRRNGTVVSFSTDKIVKAIEKAMREAESQSSQLITEDVKIISSTNKKKIKSSDSPKLNEIITNVIHLEKPEQELLGRKLKKNQIEFLLAHALELINSTNGDPVGESLRSDYLYYTYHIYALNDLLQFALLMNTMLSKKDAEQLFEEKQNSKRKSFEIELIERTGSILVSPKTPVISNIISTFINFLSLFFGQYIDLPKQKKTAF